MTCDKSEVTQCTETNEWLKKLEWIRDYDCFWSPLVVVYKGDHDVTSFVIFMVYSIYVQDNN